MDIKNNQLFDYDITHGWTKRDWILNLVPLGGAVSVVYEIGSAIVAGDQTAGIAQQFFKSPVHTTLKKLAQCLWVPIVICGALQLISFIVTACWARYFPHVSNQLRKKSSSSTDPCEINPVEVVFKIFSFLNLHELIEGNKVRKNWNSTLTSVPTLWKAAICRDIAFSSRNWAQWDKNIVEDVDLDNEFLSLPDNIVEQLRRSYKAFPGKCIKETHVLVRMPKGLNMNKVKELVETSFPVGTFICMIISQQIRDRTVDKSVWLLMKTDEIANTNDKSYIERQQIVSDLAAKTHVPYRIPTVFEAGACLLAAFSRSDTSKFRFYTICQDEEGIIFSYQISKGICLFFKSEIYSDAGIWALREF